MTSFVADATASEDTTNDHLTDATIDYATKKTVTSTEDARDGSHRRAAIVETTKIDENGAARPRLSTTGIATPTISVNKLRQWHRVTNKYSGASR